MRLRRQTIQVCAPGVSTATGFMPFDSSQPMNLRLSSIRRSSVPHAIHSKRICEAFFASIPGKSSAKLKRRSAALNPPIQAN